MGGILWLADFLGKPDELTRGGGFDILMAGFGQTAGGARIGIQAIQRLDNTEGLQVAKQSTSSHYHHIYWKSSQIYPGRSPRRRVGAVG